jgi:hypothetical protein
MKRDKTDALKLTEEQFYHQVVDLAHIFGWKVAHFRPAQTSKGWRTPVGADGRGFPDLVLAKDSVILFAELKSETGKASPEQGEWLKILNGYLWKPSDIEEIQGILRKGIGGSGD